MLTNLAFTLLLTLAGAPEPSPLPDRLVPVHFKSEALAGQQRYLAWLPPGYDRAASYPVVVLLHGLGGEGADWFTPELGGLLPLLDRVIAQGTVPPFVAIAPDGGGGYWTDHLGAPEARYGTFIDEVMADAAARFRILPAKAAIVGVSMGGHGALSRAFVDPGRWRAVVSIAGALFGEPPTHRQIYKKVWGFPADRGHWLATAPMALIQRLTNPSALPAVFLGCGRHDTDRFLPWNLAADRLLSERGIAHELVLTDGGHTWTAWRALNERWLTWLAPRLR